MERCGQLPADREPREHICRRVEELRRTHRAERVREQRRGLQLVRREQTVPQPAGDAAERARHDRMLCVALLVYLDQQLHDLG